MKTILALLATGAILLTLSGCVSQDVQKFQDCDTICKLYGSGYIIDTCGYVSQQLEVTCLPPQ